MRTIQVNLYQYDELSDAAKAKAREWYIAGDTFDPEMEPYETAAQILGITFATERDTLPDIRYSGFSSQGDGASFVGSYTFSAEAAQAIRDEFPQDKTLHSIADTLAEIQGHVAQTVTAKIEQRGRYVHSNTMALADVSPENALTEEDEALLFATMKRFANWIYICLEDDYNSCHEDEYVEEAIRANEYEFTASGERRND